MMPGWERPNTKRTRCALKGDQFCDQCLSITFVHRSKTRNINCGVCHRNQRQCL